MRVVKKTVSIPEEIYKEAQEISENFSQVVKMALKKYLKKRKKEFYLWQGV